MILLAKGSEPQATLPVFERGLTWVEVILAPHWNFPSGNMMDWKKKKKERKKKKESLFLYPVASSPFDSKCYSAHIWETTHFKNSFLLYFLVSKSVFDLLDLYENPVQDIRKPQKIEGTVPKPKKCVT